MPVARSILSSGRLRPLAQSRFPLAIHASQRYFVDAQGTPYLLIGDTAWSASVQLTTAQIDQYLDDRQARGFTAILVNTIEHEFSGNTPPERNENGDLPFLATDDFGQPNPAYWAQIDYLYAGIIARGMVPVFNPAYLGYNGGSQGWTSEINAEATSELRAYGQFQGARYPLALLSLGGDYSSDATLRARQWHVALGILDVVPGALFTAHPGPGELASNFWNPTDHPGFLWDWCYTYEKDGTYVHDQVLEAYNKNARPAVYMEGQYEGEHSTSAATLRRQTYASILSGACGAFFGNNPIWPFGSGWESALNSAGAQQQTIAKNFFAAREWWKLQPRTDTSLVSSALGSGTSRICPALASDGSHAAIYVPASTTITLVKSGFAPSLLRVDLFDPATGDTTTHTASTANSGTLSVATGGERIVVVRAA